MICFLGTLYNAEEKKTEEQTSKVIAKTVTYIYKHTILIHTLVRAMGSKSDLPHLNMPIMDTLEDLESSFNAQVRHKLTASGGTHDDDSEEFMSQVSFKLDSLCKGEEFDLSQTSPMQELSSLPSCNANTTDEQSDDNHAAAVATSVPLGNLFGDEGNEDIVDDVTDDLTDLTTCDGQLLDEDFDQSEISEASCTVSELVVRPPKFDALLESTTPLGTIYSNDATTPPVEYDPKKGKTTCGAEQHDSILVNGSVWFWYCQFF